MKRPLRAGEIIVCGVLNNGRIPALVVSFFLGICRGNPKQYTGDSNQRCRDLHTARCVFYAHMQSSLSCVMTTNVGMVQYKF